MLATPPAPELAQHALPDNVDAIVAYALNQADLTMGAAFGLFAIFSMLRYRTDAISATDMTYLFLVIALGMLTSIYFHPTSSGRVT